MIAAYPLARRLDLTESINGFTVADPYRWLEEPDSEETRAWLTGQDALYAEQLAATPGRESLAARLAELAPAGVTANLSWNPELLREGRPPSSGEAVRRPGVSGRSAVTRQVRSVGHSRRQRVSSAAPISAAIFGSACSSSLATATR